MAGSEYFPPAEAAPALVGGLYITATPIGNLKDITIRAVQVLQAADLIACEDTRVTSKLLSVIGARAKTVAYHDHSGERDRERIMDALRAGQAVALVSDAGTPMISDPGYRLVSHVRSEGLPVHTLPGPCAAIAALTLAGLPTDRFVFAGFPPSKSAARQTWYRDFKRGRSTLVVYESGRRLASSLADALTVFGDRQISVSREISKKFEETRTGSLTDLCVAYSAEDAPRGELVIVIASDPEAEAVAQSNIDSEGMLKKALVYMRTKDAAALIADLTGLKKRDLYQQALFIEQED